jgi:hypothetical protein
VNRERSITDQIALVERRVELRRERTVRHWQEARAATARATRWVPLLFLAGAFVVGLGWGRQRETVPAQQVPKVGLLATLMALGGSALRIALSPQSRALWTAFRATRKPANR